MFQTFRRFVRGVSANLVGQAGVVLTTSAFVVFVVMELFQLMGVITNAYVGLISYLALPALFVVGLVLIPIGWWRFRQSTGLSTSELLSARFGETMVAPQAMGSKLFATIFALTSLNVVFLGAGSARMLTFMDGPEFCGTACHSVMGPEWATYQDSPHASVRCVDCHVGEGAQALWESKVNGAWQLVSVTFDLYERPIPAPVHNLRPATETCATCHWSDKSYGQQVEIHTVHAFDRDSTPQYSTLSLKIGAPDEAGSIHWHNDPANAVRYGALDDKRKEIAWTEVLQADGSWKRYARADRTGEVTGEVVETRTMDCVDCHNRATHIYDDPEEAVDQAIADGRIDGSIPFIKKAAFAALTGSYPGDDRALAHIEADLVGFYKDELPDEYPALATRIAEVVPVLQAVYAKNIHPGMKVGWNPYPDHLGHDGDDGCFRCHDQDMVDEDGQAVPYECTLCHSILALESDAPYAFLEPLDPDDPDYEMHRALQAEFMGTPPEDPRLDPAYLPLGMETTATVVEDPYAPSSPEIRYEAPRGRDPYAPADPDELFERKRSH